jgi:outer membrane lipoprotein SlyB
MPGIEDAPREIRAQLASQSTVQPYNTGETMLKRTHPMFIIAAGAVTLFSLVGIGVMTGVIPNANSKDAKDSAAASVATFTPSPVAPGLAQAPLGSNMTEAAASPEVAPVAKPAPQEAKAPTPPARSVVAAPKPSAAKSPATTPTPRFEETGPSSGSERVASAPVVSAPAPVASAPMAICNTCGTVESVTPITEQGKGSGVGAAIGGVVGGVLGHQVGGGRGKDVATVAGAVGGALLGNQVEKSNKTTQSYEVRVRLDDGSYQNVRSQTEPGLRAGDKVRVENGRIVRG